MALRRLLLLMGAVIRRLRLSRSATYRQTFVDLAPLLIRMQDRRVSFVDGSNLLSSYRPIVITMVKSLAWVREAKPIRGKQILRLPRGCRIGKLQLSPLLQLAKLIDAEEIRSVQFEALPQTCDQLHLHFYKRIGLAGYAGEPPCFETLFGFSFISYVDQLFALRSIDPVLFTMLASNEFELAQGWAEEHRPAAKALIRNGATVAEIERLVEMVSFVADHRASHAQLREAVRILAKGPNTNCKEATLAKHRRLQPHVDQLGLGVEALRALFLGDQSKDEGGEPLAPETSWSATTTLMRRVAVTRCAWFAKDNTVPIRGFRCPPKRFVRSRRVSAYTYYGIPLDALLIIGLKDLSLSVEKAGGVSSVNALGCAIWESIIGEPTDFSTLR